MPLTSEQNLLLASIQPEPDPQRIEDFLHEPIDWSGFIDLATLHGVKSIVYRTWRKIKPAGLPEEVRHQFKSMYQKNAASSMWLMSGLYRILDRFANEGIIALPFRGPVLSHFIHGDIAVRQCGDIDLLIHRRDLDRAKEILLTDGFAMRGEWITKHEAVYRRHFYSLTFIRLKDQLNVDLHWNIASPAFSRFWDFEAVCSRSQSMALDGRILKILSPMDWLIALSIHAAKHVWSRLLWIHDISCFVDKDGSLLNWPSLKASVGKTGDSRKLVISLMLCRDLFGWSAGYELDRRLKVDRTAIKIEKRILEKMFSHFTYLEQDMWHNLISYRTLNHFSLNESVHAKWLFVIDKILFRSRFGED